jgi:crotonobetaine/carnitine-CoA ligase
VPQTPTIGALIDDRAAELGDKPFVVYLDDDRDTLTYAGLAAGARAMARSFAAAGLLPGQAVGQYLPNTSLFTKSMFGALYSGVIDVPINPEFRGKLLEFALRKTDIRAVVTTIEGARSLMELPDAALAPLLFVAYDLQGEPALDAPAGKDGPQWVTVNDLLAHGEAAPADNQPWADVTGLAKIGFTSGTTGHPKATGLSQSHVMSWARNFSSVIEYGRDDVLYGCFPFYHTLGGINGMVGTLLNRATYAVVRRFSARRYWDDLASCQATRGLIIPDMIPTIMGHEPAGVDYDADPRILFAGKVMPEFQERFNVRLVELYGLTEGNALSMRRRDDGSPPESKGKVNPDFDVRVFDEDDNEVPRGEAGEIVFRPKVPHHMMLGYYGDDAYTVSRWRNLWFHSGDRGSIDEQDYLFLEGRLGDKIRRRGVNLSAEQIEEVVVSLPEIALCAAISVPADLGEEEIKICVVPAGPRDWDEGALVAKLTDLFPKYMIPRFVQIRDELPLSSGTNRIQRSALRTEGDRGRTEDTWDREYRDYWRPAGPATTDD